MAALCNYDMNHGVVQGLVSVSISSGGTDLNVDIGVATNAECHGSKKGRFLEQRLFEDMAAWT